MAKDFFEKETEFSGRAVGSVLPTLDEAEQGAAATTQHGILVGKSTWNEAAFVIVTFEELVVKVARGHEALKSEVSSHRRNAKKFFDVRCFHCHTRPWPGFVDNTLSFCWRGKQYVVNFLWCLYLITQTSLSKLVALHNSNTVLRNRTRR